MFKLFLSVFIMVLYIGTTNASYSDNYNINYNIPINTSTVSGFKLNSSDNAGLSGWNIRLLNTTTGLEITNTTTDSTGFYKFTDLPDGTYNVTEVAKSGWTNATPISQIVSVDGQDITNVNFTNMFAMPTIQVMNPSSNPSTILNDSVRARPPGTNISTLNVTVIGGVSSVTINLSPVGGPIAAPMTNIQGTNIYSIAINATAGINMTNDLIVNATDTNGNFNNSVSIPLTVLLRGDIKRDGNVDLKDLLLLRKYIAESEPPINMSVGDIFPSTGDGKVDLKDLLFLRNYIAGLEPWI